MSKVGLGVKDFFKIALRLGHFSFNRSNLSFVLSVLCLAVGVATLLVTLAIVNGYEKSLKQSIFDAQGHVMITQWGRVWNSDNSLRSHLSQAYENEYKLSPFLMKEALMAHQGKVTGVVVEGVESGTLDDVTNIKSRVLTGGTWLSSDSLKDKESVIGLSLAQAHNLKVGDSYTVVFPMNTAGDIKDFTRKPVQLKVKGIIDLGKHDINKRYIFVPINLARTFLSLGPTSFSGARLKLQDPDQAIVFRESIRSLFGGKYWVKIWKDVHASLQEAIEIERRVIFFILMILILLAAFNTCAHLYLSVTKRIREVSVLKTLGVQNSSFLYIFLIQGFMLGFLGFVFGLVLALLILQLLTFLLSSGVFVPPEVYKQLHIHSMQL